MKFEELNLAPAILKAVREQGYEEPTPIQEKSIPIILEGHDLLAGAQNRHWKDCGIHASPFAQTYHVQKCDQQVWRVWHTSAGSHANTRVGCTD